MRRNEPVTQIEYPFPKGSTLLSVTDEKGRILLANRTFIEVSGFNRADLIGKAHNIVRHPDVPPEAFADMWRTLKAGLPWTGVVKNRRCNGDHYWVCANVTPVQRDGRILGYVSVRDEPTRQQIAAADALYREIREGRSAYTVDRGVVVRAGWLRWLSLGRTASTRTRLALSLGLAVLPAAAAAGLLGLSAGGIATLAGALGLGAALGFALGEHQILAPLRHVCKVACRAAGGLEHKEPELNRTDDIGMMVRAINQMGSNQAAVIGHIKSGIDGLYHATQEIAEGNMDLSRRTEEQAANLEKTSSSMEQMSSSVQNSSHASHRATDLARDATLSAQRGGEVVHQVTARMEEIAASSTRISDIISVIDGIAFQTNILALNAAVEAARAGEQGRGFAVVASEVRTLAQRSAEAAKEIKELIDQSVSSIQAGSAAVSGAGSTMDQIVQQVQQVASLIEEIAIAINEQNAGIKQINVSVTHTDQVTQQNAALVEQTAAAASSLKEQTDELRGAIASFEFAELTRSAAVLH